MAGQDTLARCRNWAKRFLPGPSVLPGRMLLGAWRLRRALLVALRAERAEQADRRAGRIPPAPPVRSHVETVVCFVSGPGRPGWLEDSIESVLASDGDRAHVIVIDDCSVDARESIVRERFPGVEVLRRRVPSGGPPQTWPQVQLGLRHALDHYDFDRFVRMDTDALVVGPGLSSELARALDAVPGAGLAGSFRVRADGAPEDRAYQANVLAQELRHDRLLADAVARARSNGWREGEIVMGGAMCLTADAVDALRREGWLDWHQPWHSIVTDDLALAVFGAAAGLGLCSIGDPQGIFAVANKHLPLPKEELASGRWLVTHSTRVGLHGEDEATLRDFFRARRAEWPSPGPYAASTVERHAV